MFMKGHQKGKWKKNEYQNYPHDEQPLTSKIIYSGSKVKKIIKKRRVQEAAKWVNRKILTFLKDHQYQEEKQTHLEVAEAMKL